MQVVPGRPGGPLVRLARRAMARVLAPGARRPRAVDVHGVSLLVLPDVFDPKRFRSSEMLAEVVRDEVRAGERVLDLGTGSGVGAIFAARQGANVVAVDINPSAVRCARLNAALHGLGDRVEVRHGDLLAPVEGERFDVVIFNPPFFRGEPKADWEHAWRGSSVLERFAEELSGVLAEHGRALLVLSTDGACGDLVEGLTARGFQFEIRLRRRWPGEIMTVYRVAVSVFSA